MKSLSNINEKDKNFMKKYFSKKQKRQYRFGKIALR